MSGLSDVEREAERAAQALRIAAAYLRTTGPERVDGAATPQEVAVGEGLAAAERVLGYLRKLRRPGDGASVAYPGRFATWHDWCPHGTAGVPRQRPLPGTGRGDPGE